MVLGCVIDESETQKIVGKKCRRKIGRWRQETLQAQKQNKAACFQSEQEQVNSVCVCVCEMGEGRNRESCLSGEPTETKTRKDLSSSNSPFFPSQSQSRSKRNRLDHFSSFFMYDSKNTYDVGVSEGSDWPLTKQ